MDILSSLTSKLISSLSNFGIHVDIGGPTEIVIIWMSAVVTLSLIVLSFTYLFKYRTCQPVQPNPQKQENHKHLFRKRDTMQFYANKVLTTGRDTASMLQRKVSDIGQKLAVAEYSESGRRLKNRVRRMILAKRIFTKHRTRSLVERKEIPSMLLEPDEQKKGLPDLSEEVLYLLRSVKVFGNFKEGVFFQLCRHMETISLSQGDYLFQVGEDDKWLYVVQKGQINLYITEDNNQIKLSEVTEGESLYSLLSILDVLTGHMAPYKRMLAQAVKKSVVLRLPAEAFSEAIKNHNDSLVQIVQVIMTSLQRVTFLALHNYLGLSQELLDGSKRGEHKLSVRKLSSSSVLADLVKKHKLSVEDLKEQLDCEDHLEEEPNASSTYCHEGSSSPLTSKAINGLKQIRFNEIDAVMGDDHDSDDNVFRRQSSLPSDQRKKDFCSMLKQIHCMSTSRDSKLPRNSSMTSDDSAKTKFFKLNEPEVLELVADGLCQILGIADREFVQANIELMKVRSDYQLFQEGDQDVGIYFVVTGNLQVFQSQHDIELDEQREVTLFVANPGMLVGHLAMLTGEPSFFCVRALSDSVVARITKQNFYLMMSKFPHMILHTAHTVVSRVSPFVRQIDFALDWILIEAGKPLYKQGNSSDSMYIILHGRLRAVYIKPDGKKEMVTEFGKGEIVGMMESLRGVPRYTSVHAIRDTELAKIPEGMIKYIRRHHPHVITRLISHVSDKLLGNMMSQNRVLRNRPAEVHPLQQSISEKTSLAYGDVANHLANLSTVAIMPASNDVPLDKFSMELHHAMTHVCTHVLRLDSDLIKEHLGNHVFESSQEYRLSKWLAQQEDLHKMVLYQTDPSLTSWTQCCIRQADAVLIVALGDGKPGVGELERQVENMAVRSLKMLVLLHRPEVVLPTRTVEWLNMRGWLNNHIHIKGPERLFAQTKKSELKEYWNKLMQRLLDRYSDFSRLARFLTGTSVALVLGGGGARGLSQIGIISSLVDAGVPIDMVGGTSIGAFMGGLWAAHRDVTILRESAEVLCQPLTSTLSKVLDLTYPFASLLSGAAFNQPLQSIFKDTQIEDLWLPYFTVTTDVTSSQMRVHMDGDLWRYVRASMSYHPYVPPVCDPRDGHLLVDGCFVNNLPGDVARSRGACKVLAVDVGSEFEQDFTTYGDHLCGWWVLWRRWTGRWTGRIKLPDMGEIQSRLSYISSNYLLEKVRHSDYCHYFRLPVAHYKTGDFHKLTELCKIGIDFGNKIFTDEWTMDFWRDLLQDFAKSVATPATSKSRSNVFFNDLTEHLNEFEGKREALLSDAELQFGFDLPSEIALRTVRSLRRRRTETQFRNIRKTTNIQETGQDEQHPNQEDSPPSFKDLSKRKRSLTTGQLFPSDNNNKEATSPFFSSLHQS